MLRALKEVWREISLSASKIRRENAVRSETVVFASARSENQADFLPPVSPARTSRPFLESSRSSVCDGLISVLFLLAYENEDQLLWDPNILPEREVEEFLYRAVKRRWDELSSSSLPEGEVVKDNEQVRVGAPADALVVLLQPCSVSYSDPE